MHILHSFSNFLYSSFFHDAEVGVIYFINLYEYHELWVNKVDIKLKNKRKLNPGIIGNSFRPIFL